MQRVRSLARNAVTVLNVVAALAVISAGAELWRYILLVQSRDSALSAAVVGASDALVLAGALLTFLFGLGAIALTVWWLLLARSAAAAAGDQEPARPGWQVVLGVLLPGLNLMLAGSIVAELEHAVLRRPVAERPRPSRLVLGWWAVWVVNAVLVVLTVVWRFRDGVQAMADGVLLNVFVDMSAAGLAALTAALMYRLTELLTPIPTERLRPMRVLRVSGAPAPRLRATRPPGSPR